MFKSILTLFTIGFATTAVASTVPITGNVESKCTIYTDTEGVYGNPTPDALSTSPADGGVLPVVRYDVSIADYYKARIAWPNAFSTSPSLTDTLNWDGSVAVSLTSDVAMADYETNKVTFDNTTEYDLTVAGSTWFEVTSTVTYGVGKSLPGGTYKANVTAECIAK